MTPDMKGFLLVTVLKLLVVFTVTMIGVALLTLMERKVSAWMQYRLGPNRVGFWGLAQPAADGIKNIIKEETFPGMANRVLFTLAPTLSFIPAMTLASVIHWAAPLPVAFDFTLPVLGRFHYDALMPMAVADLPVGILFVFAVSSMGVYGIALAGWSSNSKYALLGGLRASAQMISYEVAMGLSFVVVFLYAGSMSTSEIVEAQTKVWFLFPLLPSFIIYVISMVGETNRAPFDLPEAEGELVGGFHTEYSSLKFALFFLAAPHLFQMLTQPGMIGPYESADRVWSYRWWPLYILLLFAVEVHGGVGLYRLAVKWGWFAGANPDATRKRLKALKWALTAFFLALGLATLAAYVKIGIEHADRVGERYVPAHLQQPGAAQPGAVK